MSSFMKMPRILGTLIIVALVVPGISSTALVQSTYASPNEPPVLDPIGDNQTNEAQLLEFTITASDPDGDALTYSASNLPDGATFDALSDPPIFSWTPAYDQAGVYPGVHFKVSDGTLFDSENITITVVNVNRPPVLDPIGDNQTDEAQLLEFTITASDPDGDALTYSASNLPDGATFDALSDPPIFSWTPAYDQAGVYPGVHFEVTDGDLFDSEDITITVGDVNRPPVVESVTADPDRLWPPNHKDVAVTIMIDVTDPDGAGDIGKTTYSVTDEYGIYNVTETDLPEDGVISLVAERYGGDRDGRFYTITVTAYDAGGPSNNGTVHVVVPHDQGKRGKPVTAHDAGEVSDGGNANVVVPPGQSKKGKKGKSGKRQ